MKPAVPRKRLGRLCDIRAATAASGARPHLLMCLSGPDCGKVHRAAPPPGAPGSYAAIILKSPDIDESYLFAVLGVLDFARRGNGGNSIPLHAIRSAIVPVPTLAEQRRIAARIEELGAVVTAAKQGVRAAQESSAMLSARVAADLMTTGAPAVKSGTVGSFCTLRGGYAVPKDAFDEKGELPYLSIADLSRAENSSRITTAARFAKTPRVRRGAIIPAGAIIVPRRGWRAFGAEVRRQCAIPLCLDPNLMAVIPPPDLLPDYLELVLQTFEPTSLGSAAPSRRLNAADIASLPLAYPADPKAQRRRVERVQVVKAAAEELGDTHAKTVARLKDLQKALIRAIAYI